MLGSSAFPNSRTHREVVAGEYSDGWLVICPYSSRFRLAIRAARKIALPQSKALRASYLSSRALQGGISARTYRAGLRYTC